MTHIVVVGAGQAAVALAAKLRGSGFDGELTVAGDEPVTPYQRPALSKKYLLGEMSAERLQLRPDSFYEQNNITLLLGQAVSAIDTAARSCVVGDRLVHYDKLALTTGSTARSLAPAIGRSLGRVYSIRTLADVDALEPELRPSRRVLVIGGGYIGLEAAAVAAKMGLLVTVVEMGERILSRVAAAQTAEYFSRLHRAKGVTLLQGVSVVRLTGSVQVSGAILSDGTQLEVDFVIAGVGIVPATSLAQAAGIDCANGIAVDQRGRTSAPGVWAAGDCTSFPWRGARIRLECVQNAIEQAETVALDMMGHVACYDPTPWFWSDQFDTKLQIAGLNSGYDDVVTRLGSDGRMSVWYFRGEHFCAIDAMDDPRAYMVGRQLLRERRSPDKALVADLTSDLKSLL